MLTLKRAFGYNRGRFHYEAVVDATPHEFPSDSDDDGLGPLERDRRLMIAYALEDTTYRVELKRKENVIQIMAIGAKCEITRAITIVGCRPLLRNK